jgi:hypothetical protein
MQHPLRWLPRSVKLWVWRTLDRLGEWPQPIKVGPARGLVLGAPLRRSSSYCTGKYEPHGLDAQLESHILAW